MLTETSENGENLGFKMLVFFEFALFLHIQGLNAEASLALTQAA